MEYFRILETSGSYEEARDQLLGLLKEKPNDGAILRALAVVYGLLDQPAQVFRCYQKALQANPQDAQVHFDLGLLYLQHGNYLAGFVEYEWRRNLASLKAPANAPGAKPWDGRELREEALVLHCEQGLGDCVQFIRFLPHVRERVAKIYLVCYPALLRLFSGLEGLAGIVAEKEPLPPCQYHCSLLSLPRVFKTTLETLPKAVPYLPLAGVERLAGARPRIGFVWRAKADSANGGYRSVPLAELRPLADLPVEWISLQKDITDEEQTMLRTEFAAEERGSTFQDLKDTADLVETLDLVLTVDTSIAHIGGALARPTWVLVPRYSDWRWLLDRSDSPWYPTAALFRQETNGDWAGPIRAVRDELRNRFFRS
ncbi:MAG TPA: tetratricopeptide repeat protein [Candidatus Methylacidiphilales bacterium]|nr:tetratricopeptide repeat protein [Candidatus Methylacidiphilales bacterium]